jgi:D-alanyl-lipoteichoic acid acyltransferase DltB (MBOAT superfamily)
VAGPVERSGNFLPQIDTPKRFDYARITDGLRIIAGGLFKKLVVADRLSIVVNGVYSDSSAYGGVALLLTSVCYMFQLYYDFCGYSEIAVGTARVLGYDLVWNFNRPYAARSIADYWRRWHISLTTWFFEYVYAPVAATLRNSRRASIVVAMMTTFLVSGLWHGAQWTFVAYGVMHGIAMCLYFLSTGPRKRLKRRIAPRLYGPVAWAITFIFVACVDVLFRANSIGDAGAYLYREAIGLPPDLLYLAQRRFSVSAIKTLIAGLPILKMDLLIAVTAVVCVELVSFLARRQPFREQLSRQPVWIRWPAYYLVAGSILYLGSQNSATTFIYMRF